MFRRHWALLAALVLSRLIGVSVADAADPAPIDFDSQIRPLLSDRCFSCHGPDTQNREAELRLDVKAGAFAPLDSDETQRAVVPGDLKQSVLYQRIVTSDPDLLMPPADSKLKLSKEEIELIRRWIEQGADWQDHWAFQTLGPIPRPAVKNQAWPANAIDRFVLAKIEQRNLQPAPEAAKTRLIRRVTYSLTGLPPTLAEIDAFLADDSSQAYERVVDRLLASPRYGERMAVDWLDVARYADTYGYQADRYRDVWPWRDWVVRAFNDNLPYDDFITWQIAGDLLPNPTRDQRLATAFNRLHRQTNEGGSIEEEFRIEYVCDRVQTFGTAFLGLTFECARCHDHKYDPVTQQNYYELSAFFNSIDESGLYSHFTDAVPTPTLLLTTEEQDRKIADLSRQIIAATDKLEAVRNSQQAAFAAWRAAGNQPDLTESAGLIGHFRFEVTTDNAVPNEVGGAPGKLAENPEPIPSNHGQGLKLSGENKFTTKVGGDFTRDDPFSIGLWIKVLPPVDRAVIYHRSRAWTDAGSRGYQLLLEEGKLSASLIHFWPGNAIRIRTQQAVPLDQWLHVMLTYDGSSRAAGLKLFVDGRRAPVSVVRDHLTKTINGGGADELTIGERFRDRGFKNGSVDEFRIYNRALSNIEIAALAADGKLAEEPNDASLFDYYLSRVSEPHAELQVELQRLRKKRSALVDPIPEIMTMSELSEPRPTHFLERGRYDAPTRRVYRNAPEGLLPMSVDLPRNRLGLARWLTDPRHPLTARVAVNRIWQQLFGSGLVETGEDFGSQGSRPTHPRLINYLAYSFIDSGWDVKALIKQIVMSSTYRQDSDCSPEVRRIDPENRRLARAPRYRLSAEMIRDGALASAGLLVEQLGGAPVKPYQPAGLWKEKSGQVYKRDSGAGSRRRSLYTYWKRTSPPPAMMTLDAAKRDVCVARRQATATPLQSLVLLNDPQYIEAARALAQRAMLTAGDDLTKRVEFLFRTVTARRPKPREVTIIEQLYREQLATFAASTEQTKEFLAIGDHQPDPKLKPANLAAMTVVAELLLNFDEAVMQR